MKKVRILELILLLCSLNGIIAWLFYPINSFKDSEYNSCTIFTVTEGDKVYFCNNEDYYPRQMRMWFFPASEGKHGKVLYGFTIHDAFNPLGGMNDEGLSADENWVPSTPLKRDPNKQDYIRNNLFTRLLEDCATVVDVIEWIKDYNLVQLETYPCQIHIADKTGDAVVIGIDPDGNVKTTRKTGDYLISTNFNLAFGRKSCWRYETVKRMLNQPHAATINYYRSILKAASQWHSSYPFTKYSYINDLQNRILYFYSPHNYEYFVTINLDKELSKGFHSYDIFTLISQQGGFPPHMSLIISTFIMLSAIIMGCAAIWIFKIKPEIKNIKKQKIITKQQN